MVEEVAGVDGGYRREVVEKGVWGAGELESQYSCVTSLSYVSALIPSQL